MQKLATVVPLAALAGVAGVASQEVVPHHGIDRPNSPALVHRLRPRVAIMNNATRKGGRVEHNAAGTFIANVDDNETIAGVLTAPPPVAGRQGGPRGGGTPAHTPARWLLVPAQRDGSFTVTTLRNGFSRTSMAAASR